MAPRAGLEPATQRIAKERRKYKQRSRRLVKGAKPRKVYEGESKTKRELWKALELSRATYYRKRLHETETSVKPVMLTLKGTDLSRHKHTTAKAADEQQGTVVKLKLSAHSTPKTGDTDRYQDSDDAA